MSESAASESVETTAMTITVNGQQREVPDDCTVIALLDVLNLKPKATVVQRNDDIVDSADYDTTILSEGDTLELVRFVGGG